MSAVDRQRIRHARVLEHLPLVRSVVRSVHRDIPGGIEREDLESIGIIGLIEAIDRYDAKRGVPFDAYARHRIRGALIDEMRAQGWVPRAVRQRGREVEEAREHLSKRLGRAPRVGEVAKALDMAPEVVEKARIEDELRSMVSLDSPTGDEGSRLEELVAGGHDTEAEVARNDVATALRQACETLSPVEQQAVAMRFFDDLRLKEIGRSLGVSESRVCQLCRAATDRLRKRLDERLAA